jgi:hypothetical protein
MNNHGGTEGLTKQEREEIHNWQREMEQEASTVEVPGVTDEHWPPGAWVAYWDRVEQRYAATLIGLAFGWCVEKAARATNTADWWPEKKPQTPRALLAPPATTPERPRDFDTL